MAHPSILHARRAFLLILFLVVAEGAAIADTFNGVFVPGEVIAHSPASSGIYIGSPSIAILPNGDYIASYDENGPGSSEGTSGITRIYRSADQGQSWSQWSVLTDQFWSNLFVHNDDLYIMGPRHGPTSGSNTDRDLLIRKSTNGGATWTTPTNASNGLLAEHPLGSFGFHTAPVPMVEHNGRLWRALEVSRGDFRPTVISVPVDSDLLDANNWQLTNTLAHQDDWLPNNGFNFWMEGNVVVAPNDQLVNILRISVAAGQPEKAAIVHVQNTDNTPYLRLDPANDIIDLPGASKKFTIRYDSVSDSYWALTNIVNEDNYDANATPGGIRNIVALLKSPDLINWETRSIILQDLTDVDQIGFQYWDWQFDGDDIAAVSRTAHPDGLGGADSFHNSNFLTFHRIEDFRTVTGVAFNSVPEPTTFFMIAALAGLLVVCTRKPKSGSLYGVLLLCLFNTPQANASLLVTESFDYPAGNLHGNNGGVGWLAGWQVTSSTGSATVTANSLPFSDLSTTGGAARIELGNTGGSFQAMDSLRTLSINVGLGEDLWMSFLYQQPNPPLQDFSSRIAELRINTLKMRVRPKQSHLQGVAISYDGQTYGDSDVYNVQDGNVYLMIARFGDIGQATGKDAVMWVMDEAGYDVVKYGGVTQAELNANSPMILSDPHDNQTLSSGERLQMLVADSSDTNFAAMFDEIRYGTSLADVLPGSSAPYPGDYNDDGSVDAADYTVWRDTLGSTSDLRADGSGPSGLPNGIVDSFDYDLWKNNYSAAASSSGTASNAIPEPSSVTLIAVVGLVFASYFKKNP